MIQLTRLNNSILGVNSDLIKFVEVSPDTVITLTTGEKIIVKETFDEINRKMLTSRRLRFVDAGPIEGDPGG